MNDDYANGLPGEGTEWDQTYRDAGYIWCRPDQEWHRPPECPINGRGDPVPYWLDD